MTKEEIMTLDIELLGEHFFELFFQEIEYFLESKDCYFHKNRCPKHVVKYHKQSIKKVKYCIDERMNILKLRPGVIPYIQYIIERCKKHINKVIVKPYPGVYLLDYIYEYGIYIEDFADDLKISKGELLSILSGKSKITEDLAVRLSEVIGTSPDVWLNLQKNYDDYFEENENA